MKFSATEFRESPRDRKLLLFAIVAILLLISLSRIVRLSPPGIIDDETWSVWQTLGNPAQIVAWTPYDWPPLYYLIMGFWKSFVGIYPEADRFLSVLLILVGSAAMYRVARRLSGSIGLKHSQVAGLLAMLAFAGPGYSILISIYQRGYSVLLGLSPVVLWVVVRYFYRPTWRRAAWIAALCAIMFYIHYTAVLFFVMVGVFTLILYRQRIWLWWRPALLGAPLVLPGILAHLALSR